MPNYYITKADGQFYKELDSNNEIQWTSDKTRAMEFTHFNLTTELTTVRLDSFDFTIIPTHLYLTLEEFSLLLKMKKSQREDRLNHFVENVRQADTASGGVAYLDVNLEVDDNISYSDVFKAVGGELEVELLYVITKRYENE